MQRILFLENKMQDATSQERTQEGQLTRLNPISGEDSGHTSIGQERTVNTPQSWSGEDTYLHIRRGHTSILWERNISIPTCGRGESCDPIAFTAIRSRH